MSKKMRPTHPTASRRPNWLWLVAAAAVLIVAGVLLVWNSGGDQTTTGSPQLTVDQTVIDEGYLPYSTPVETAFRIKNTGDGPLKIIEQPRVVLTAGC